MSGLPTRVIRLAEYKSVKIAENELEQDLVRLIWERYRKQIDVVGPSFQNEHRWELTSIGWVGQIPLTDSLVLALEPKTPIQNLFGMLEYAYRLQGIHLPPDLVHTDSLQHFYEQLANVLAKRIIDRSRRGLYRTYRPEDERLPYIRGRIDLARASRSPWDTKLHCQYEDHTADVDDNRILAWTLWRIVRSGYCTERVLPTVRRAFRILQSAATLEPYSSDSCVGRSYHRLNQDYQPLHALSRFFLDQGGPSHYIGDREMTPFLVNMASLFEMFVAEWLKEHAPKNWRIKDQMMVPFGVERQRHFRPDIVVEDINTGEVLLVLDTKYKVTEEASNADIHQMVTYAHLLNCDTAVLIFPTLPTYSGTFDMRDIHIHSLSFAIDHDLEKSGHFFLGELETILSGMLSR